MKIVAMLLLLSGCRVIDNTPITTQKVEERFRALYALQGEQYVFSFTNVGGKFCIKKDIEGPDGEKGYAKIYLKVETEPAVLFYANEELEINAFHSLEPAQSAHEDTVEELLAFLRNAA